MLSKRLEFIKENPALLANYSQALSLLMQSGVIDVLREVGRVRFIPVDTPNYSQVLANEMQYSLGFNDALSNLEFFVERYINPTYEGKQTVLDFGAIDRALESGDLTKEEADAIRAGNPIPTLAPAVAVRKPSSGGTGSKGS